jgi:Mrp family chromosome partitioning ATPase/capsular polysaccharide biosynthesis protein
MTVQPTDRFYGLAQALTKGTAPATERPEPFVPLTEAPGGMFGLREVWRFLRRRGLLLASVTVAGGLLTAAILAMLPLSFTATSQIVLQRTDSRPFEVVDREERDRSAVETEIDMIESRYMAGRVVDRLGMLGNSEGPAREVERDMLVKALAGALRVSRSGESLALQISVSHPDPEKAAEIANAFATEYVAASIEFKQRWSDRSYALVQAQDSPLLQKLRDDEAGLLRSRAALASKFGDNHPRIKDSDAAIASVHALIDSERKRLAARRTTEAERPGARVISTAEVPTVPSFPQTKLMLATGLAGSFVLATLLAILIEGMDRRIRAPEDASKIAGLSSIFSVPRIPKSRSRQTGSVLEYLRMRPQSPFSEALRSIYLRNCMPASEPRRQVVLVTSCWPGEGKTTIAAAVAITAAAEGWQTVLVDLDLHSCGVADETEVSTDECSIQSILNGEYDGTGITIEHPEFPTLHVIPATHHEQPSWNARKLHSLLTYLCQKFDVVILDTPPTLVVGDAQWLAPFADTTLLVTQWGATDEGDAQAAVSSLRAAGASSVGCIINSVDLKQQARRAQGGSRKFLRYAKRYMNA